MFPPCRRALGGLLTALFLGGAGAARGDFVNFETPQVHPVALSPDGSRLAVCNTADHRLEVFEVADGDLVASASIPVGYDPVSVRFRTDTEAWVVNQISDSVSVVDLAGGVVTATLATKDEPADVVFAGAPVKAYVSCSQADTVQVFDPGNLATAPVEIPILGEDPRALAVSGDGATVFAAIFESGNNSTVLGGGLAMGGGSPPNVVSNPSGPYSGANPPPNDPGSATGFDPPLASGLDPPPPVGLIVKKDAGGAWRDDNGTDWTPWVSGASAAASGRPVGWDVLDNDVAMIDTSTNTVSYAEGLMNICMALAVNPDTEEVTVVGTDATNEIRFEPKINGTFLRVNLGRFDPASPGSPVVSDLNPHLTYANSTIGQSERDKSLGDPRGIAWNETGTRAYLTGMGSNNLIVVDATGARAGIADTVEVGEGPTGLVVDETHRRIFVLNRFEATVSIVDLDAEVELTRVPFFDPTPPEVKVGRRHLYDTHETSGLGHVSCASCHVDSRMDRLSWDLGDPSGEALTIVPATTSGVNPGPGEVVINDSAGIALLAGGLGDEFHPMKGPMTTQTLQDIIGKEPHHWRGDRQGIEGFGGAFFLLLGDDETLSAPPNAGEMQEFENYLASIHFPPNPFRNIDNTLPEDLPLPGHHATGRFALAEGTPLPNGNARRALTQVYRPIGRGIDAVACITCHALPIGIGTDALNDSINPLAPNFVTIPAGILGERHHALVSVDGSTQTAIKVPHLRNMYDKVGFVMAPDPSAGGAAHVSRAGAGFLHDGSVDSLSTFFSEPVFNFNNDQEIADMVALMLAFSGSGFNDPVYGYTPDGLEPPGTASLDAHAAVGRQVTRVDAATGTPEADLMNELLALGDAFAVDIVAKSVVGGNQRGWKYLGAGMFQTDEATVTESLASLLGRATAAVPVTFTAVPSTCGERIGIERDGDGLFDYDEVRDLVPEVPGVQNPFRPDEWDTTGDNGAVGPDGKADGMNDFDGDGMSNAEELANGTNPADNLAVNPPFNHTIAWDESGTAIVVEWDGAPLGEYEITYTSDLVGWKSPATGPIVAGPSGGRLQWVDDGPPETESEPSSVSQRFYMINRVK